MNKEIQERINAVQSGSIPNGYCEGIVGILPNYWTSKPLSEISEVISEQVGDDDYETLSISAGIGFVNQAQKFGKELSGKQYKKYTVLRKGDFAYNKGNSKLYPQGCTYRLKERDEAAVPNVFECFRITEGCPEYYEQLFISGFMNRQLTRKINHGVRDDGLLNLTDDDFYSTVLPVPPLAEQQKIAEILSACDREIELKSAEIMHLKSLKQSLTAQMFVRSGEILPALRFPGFSTEWKKHKLLSCIERIIDFRGRTPKKLGMEWSEKGYLALSALNVKDGYVDFSQDVHYGDYALYSRWMNGNELHKGQVVFTTEAPVGNVAQIPDDNGYILSQRTIAFEVKTNVLTEDFLAIILRTPSVVATLNALSSGGTAKGVSQKTLSTVDIIIPSELKEQEKLSSFFSTLNQMLSLNQYTLEMLQNRKKALMQLLLTGLMRTNN